MSDESTTPRRATPGDEVQEDHPSESTPDETLAIEHAPAEPVVPDQPGRTPEETLTIEHAAAEPVVPDRPEPDRPEPSPEQTLLIEQHPTVETRSQTPVTPVTSVGPVPPDEPVRAATSTIAAPQGGLVTVRTGPRPGAILLGLLCLMISVYTILRQTTELRLDLSLAGPVSIGALGTLLLLVGLVGLAGRRRC